MRGTTVLNEISVLWPAYFYNVSLGFIPATIKPKGTNTLSNDGPFLYKPSLMIPSLVIQIIAVYLFYDSTVIAKQRGGGFIYVALTLLYIEIYYLFVCWILYKRVYVQILNDAHRLLRGCRRPRIGLIVVDMLPYLATYGYVLKPLVLPYNFVDWPSINLLMYVRLLSQLSLESVICAALRTAEVVLLDLNTDLTLNPTTDLQQAVAAWLGVHGFISSVSRSVGTLYFPILILTLLIVVTGNLYALKPMLSGQGVTKAGVMYLVEWSGPLCSMFIVCRRSQAVFVQSRKTKDGLQCFLIKNGNDNASSKLVTQFFKLVDENNMYLKVETSLVYNSILWFMMMNLILTNMLSLLPATKYIK